MGEFVRFVGLYIPYLCFRSFHVFNRMAAGYQSLGKRLAAREVLNVCLNKLDFPEIV